MKTILITTLLAAAGTVFVAPATQAANVSVGAQSATDADFILNIEGPNVVGGAATDLEIDLGSFTQFTTTAVIPLGGLALNDLKSTFGTSWNTAHLLWGGLGGTANSGFGGHNTLILTVATNTPGNSSPLSGLPASTSSQGTQTGDANSIYSLLGNSAATVNSATAAVIGASTSNSFSQLDAYNGTTVFSSFGLSGTVDGTIGSTVPELDVYSFVSKSAANPNGTELLLGTITIDTTPADASFGKATFTGAGVVPEPASGAIFAVGVGLLGLIRRRRA